jgi:hypothetical protein
MMRAQDGQTKQSHATPQSQSVTPEDRRWLILSDEEVKGPFNNGEIACMIRPLHNARLRGRDNALDQTAQVPDFRIFPPASQNSQDRRLLLDRKMSIRRRYWGLKSVAPCFLIHWGELQPLAIFGIAFVSGFLRFPDWSAVVDHWMDTTYGYLADS